MNYETAKKILAEYYEAHKPEGECGEALAKGMQAIDDCLEMGLDGEGE